MAKKIVTKNYHLSDYDYYNALYNNEYITFPNTRTWDPAHTPQSSDDPLRRSPTELDRKEANRYVFVYFSCYLLFVYFLLFCRLLEARTGITRYCYFTCDSKLTKIEPCLCANCNMTVDSQNLFDQCVDTLPEYAEV